MQYNVDDLKAQYRKGLQDAQDNSNKSDVEFFKTRECTDVSDRGNLIRIIRPLYFNDTMIYPWLKYKQWSIPFPKWQYGRPFPAPEFFGLPDPIRDLKTSLEADNDEDAANFKLGDQNVMLIVDMENEKEMNKGVQIYKFPNACELELLDFLGDDDMPLPFDPSENGCSIYIRKTGTGRNTKYRIKKGPTGELPNAEKFIAQANRTRLTNFITVDTPEILIGAISGEYDSDAAREARKERDKTEGKVVEIHFFGAPLSKPDNDNPNEAGEASKTAKEAIAEAKAETKPEANGNAPATPSEDSPSPEMKSPSNDAEEAKAFIGKRIIVMPEDGPAIPGKVIDTDADGEGAAVLVVTPDEGETFGVYFKGGIPYKEEEAKAKPAYKMAGTPKAAETKPETKAEPEPEGDAVTDEKRAKYADRLKNLNS